jgi:hypothetical protein
MTLLKRIMKAISFILILLSGIMAIGWQIEWLDKYFLWRIVADIIGFLTIPLFPLYALVELFWHGWPTEVTIAFYFGLTGIGIAIVNFILNDVLLKANED